MNDTEDTPKEFSIDIRDIKGCKHDYYYEGGFVKCRNCTVQWFDPKKELWKEIKKSL